MEMNKMEGKDLMCKCPHHKIKAFALLVLGVALLLNALSVVTFGTVYITISVLIIVMALGKMCKCCHGMCHKMCEKGGEESH